MADNFTLYLFGDQTLDIQPYLKDLRRHEDNPILEAFLQKAYDALREEVHRLSKETRDDLPRFTCIDDIIFRKAWGARCVPLDMAVTCLYQLGTFISRVDSAHYSFDTSRVLGLCTGTLAAAAVSCSRDTLELIPAAVDAVVIAFRVGLLVADVAHRLEPLHTSERNWLIFVPGLESPEAAVKKFCEHTLLPRTNHPYVSGYAPNATMVSGSPSSLEQLTTCAGFKELQFQNTPVYAPYHASHLYCQDDIDEIVAGMNLHTVTDRSVQTPLITSDGSTVISGSFETLLKAAIAQILLHPIRWTNILDGLQLSLQRSTFKSFSIIPLGTRADQLIYKALKQGPLALGNLLPSSLSQSGSTASVSGSRERHRDSKLAIIGMSGRFPGADDTDAFWNLLKQGLDVHKPVPPLHWDAKTHVDPTGSRKNTSATPYGCWLDHPADFDARFFNISPREAPQIDPAQRLALMTAYEAIEQAGIVPDATPSTRRDRVGVFYGVTSNDWMETNSAQNIDAYFIPGGNRAFIPGRINYCFKFSGPSFAVDTACSSSLAGIHIACNSLWRGDIDTAIAGGTNVLTNPDFTAGLDRGHFLSRTGNCKTFDETADGYCRGEGIGSVILKRLDDALADNDPILGTILGAYTNHSAESESITRPHSGAQREIFSKILNQGRVEPYSVGYVEMHGTGTQVGDAGEMESVLDTFAPSLSQVKARRATHEPLYLGSAKANIGHGEAASGVTSLIKVLLMMQNNTIVPHCGIKTRINSRFPTDLSERRVNIALKPTSWGRSSDRSKPRRAFVNNFSAAGGNSALLIEEAPIKRELPTQAPDPRKHHLVAVSAKNGTSLQGNLRSLLDYVKQDSISLLGKLSYTTTARRQHHQHRVMLTISSTEELSAQLETALRDGIGMARPKGTPKVICAFTGQGAQYPGMGRELFNYFLSFRTEMRRLDQIGHSLGFPSMLPVVRSEEQDIGIFAPITVQLAGICVQIALSKLWASFNITPAAVIGHSLGEYAALNVAGVLSDADTLYLVGSRAAILQDNCSRDTHGMLVVKASTEQVDFALRTESYEIACINSPTETVLAGPKEGMIVLQGILTGKGLKSTLMKVPYAFHSSQVDPVLADLKTLAGGVVFSKPKIPVLCPLDGGIIDDIGIFGPEYLVRHSREPVNILKALLRAQKDRIITDQTIILENGPHPAISGMVKASLGSHINCLATLQRGRSAFQVLAGALNSLYITGADINWMEYHRDFKISHEVLSLPAYSWDVKEYWMQYVNDWSLRKGDPPLSIQNEPKLETTTVHRVVEETSEAQKVRIVLEADIARKDLSPLVQGHEVDGIPLCTPSVYADMALTLGTYLLKRHSPGQEKNLVDVSDMTISKALVLRAGAASQLLQAHAECDWSSDTTAVRFMSFDNSQKLQEHSRCVIRFKDKSLLQKLQREAGDVKSKVQTLRDGITTGQSARFNRPMVYRAIRPLARFHDDYRAIDEIVLNSNTLEATSRLSFEVFMNHGWGSFQIYEPLEFDKKYVTYTQMVEGVDKLWHGDVVIFDGEKVVAYFGQIAIQGVPRRVLKVVLSMAQDTKSQKSQQPTTEKHRLAPPVSAATNPAVRTASIASTNITANKVERALSIISEESGIAISDLTDSTVFNDIGIDSLLGLIVTSRFKDELELDLDFNAIFYDYPSVGELKKLLGDSNCSVGADTSASASGNTNPTPRSSATDITVPDSRQDDIASSLHFVRALQIISEESGVAIEDLTDDTAFTDVGVDSLLSLVIVSRLQEELEMDIQHEVLFMECPLVGDLKKFLESDTKSDDAITLSVPSISHQNSVESASMSKVLSTQPQRSDSEKATLAARKKAVDEYVQQYTSEFRAPTHSSSNTTTSSADKVVLITGATGSLGGHLVDQIAQNSDVKTVVCLNREKNADPYVRQQKAMRDKGIRSFDKIRPKLKILQSDSSKPQLGLSKSDYEGLVGSVTHLIHNAWPMSAKRPLAGFEPQFQIMRNLINFASDVASLRAEGFKFGFQMVSSVGVVGHYGLGNGEERTMVPEDSVDIESVLPNGYGDAKWGCERMLDQTLHRHPARFRTMAVRLGQIAGSKTSGYWNPMEHFGFLIKSSQTLKALPDVGGTVYWTPVNDIAGTLRDLVLSERSPYPIYHIENPIGQSWREMNIILADALGIHDLIPFERWVDRVRGAGQRNNPAATLLDFLDDNYLRMSCGGLVLDVRKTLEHSKTLAAVGPVTEEVVRKYIHVWKEIGFLN
ncbi:MAG: Type I Iterative PKS [Chrysothrix sp. TS-e1954]|nr:MAG: Type I Iterative PKS [Chrysothrix sp. TS-e1954]